MSNRNLFKTIAILSLLWASIASATPTPVPYGDFIGITMKFLDVQETTMTPGDPNQQYGKPKLSGDSLVFLNMNFSSFAQNGATDTTDGKLDATIESKNNNSWYIDRIRFQEYGDVTLAGTGTNATKATVANSMFITVLEVDDESLIFPEFIDVNMVMSENGDWNLADDGTVTGRLWSGVLEVDLTAILSSRGITGHATELAFSMDNTLTTQSETNTSAYIAKKVAGLTVTPVVVPEPASLALLALGGIFLRKKNIL